MLKHLEKGLWLLGFSLVLVCGIYPGIVWGVGQAFFPFEANGSVVSGPDGKPAGSLLIAQPFTKDEFFQPRPSACFYDASASSSSALASSNYALRARVARTLGPWATYAAGPKKGQRVAADLEAWFRLDSCQGRPGLVGQWAQRHPALAQAWTQADPRNGQGVDAWGRAHPEATGQFSKDHPSIPAPQASDLAVDFFKSFSKEHPGKFPSAVTRPGPDGKPASTIEPVGEGADIQANFFDLWRGEHPAVPLEGVPGDLVTASGSGLDPHITLDGARLQLDRVASKWAADLKRDPADFRKDLARLLDERARAPLGGWGGPKLINVLEINLELCRRFGNPP